MELFPCAFAEMEQPTTIYNNSDQIAPYETRHLNQFDAPTLKLFGTLQRAATYFQNRLFVQPVPPVIFSLNKNIRYRGYYKPNAWFDTHNVNFPEININPSIFILPAVDIFSVLVHEQVHHYQHIHGTPSSHGYHNQQFAEIMRSIGLQCSNTGKPGGKETGRQMSQYIINDGLFRKAVEEMPEELLIPFKLVEEVTTIVDPVQLGKYQQAKESKRKKKYTCLGYITPALSCHS